MVADGFDDAIIGIDEKDMCRVVYDYNKMVCILIDEGMTEEDAIEYLSFNVFGSYVGEMTPIFVNLIPKE
jgi:hypothetical protein